MIIYEEFILIIFYSLIIFYFFLSFLIYTYKQKLFEKKNTQIYLYNSVYLYIKNFYQECTISKLNYIKILQIHVIIITLVYNNMYIIIYI